MAKADNLEEGAVAILRNSSFLRNTASEYRGGVVHTAEYAVLLVEGDANVFAYNEVTTSGAVFAGTTYSTVVIEGGEFFDNMAEKVGHRTFRPCLPVTAMAGSSASGFRLSCAGSHGTPISH